MQDQLLEEGVGMKFDPETITALAAAVVAILAATSAFLVTASKILAELRKNTRATVAAAEVGQETHAIVNSQREAAEAQQARSDNRMRDAGVPLPFNPAAKVQPRGTEPGTL
jgi:hypothetical protein